MSRRTLSLLLGGAVALTALLVYRVGTTGNSAQSARHTEVSQAAAPAPAPKRPQPLPPEERKARARAALATWYANLDALFLAEPIDPAWAPDATRHVRQLMAARKAHAKLQSARCATTMCKVAVSHADRQMQRDFAARLSEDPLGEGEIAYKYDPDATPPTTTMWMARAGRSLPRVQRK